MAVAPTPAEVYRRAVLEGERRLSASMLERAATGFNAGFTIVFGVAALGIVHALVEPRFGPELAKLAGAAAFGAGLVALIVSRSELFTENFFDPVATAFDHPERLLPKLLGLWGTVAALNVVGAAILLAILSVDEAMPIGAEESLLTVANEMASRSLEGTFANAVVGGALVTLLSFLLQAVDSVASRIAVAYLVGFILAVGPLAHAVVTAAHLLFSLFNGGSIALSDAVSDFAVVITGNLIGGLTFVTLTHLAQARAEDGANPPSTDDRSS